MVTCWECNFHTFALVNWISARWISRQLSRPRSSSNGLTLVPLISPPVYIRQSERVPRLVKLGGIVAPPVKPTAIYVPFKASDAPNTWFYFTVCQGSSLSISHSAEVVRDGSNMAFLPFNTPPCNLIETLLLALFGFPRWRGTSSTLSLTQTTECSTTRPFWWIFLKLPREEMRWAVTLSLFNKTNHHRVLSFFRLTSLLLPPRPDPPRYYPPRSSVLSLLRPGALNMQAAQASTTSVQAQTTSTGKTKLRWKRRKRNRWPFRLRSWSGMWTGLFYRPQLCSVSWVFTRYAWRCLFHVFNMGGARFDNLCTFHGK